jgi:chloramphenicol-sensitive protein RarD
MNTKLGIISALAAFTFWGFVAIYWKQITAFKPEEVMASRTILSFLTMLVYFIISKNLEKVKIVLKDRKQITGIIICALLLLVNWTTFLFAVYSEHIVEASLGYFINPLVSVFLGVLVLKESLRTWQWSAIFMAFIGIAILFTQGVGEPWIALVLAATFGMYGLVRKMTPFPTEVGILGETFLMSIPAIGYLFYLGSKGELTYLHADLSNQLYLSFSGVITILPLVFFGLAVKNLKLSTVGLIQYLGPTLQLIVGVMIYNESFTQTHLIAFTFIWIALIIYSVEGLMIGKVKEAAIE